MPSEGTEVLQASSTHVTRYGDAEGVKGGLADSPVAQENRLNGVAASSATGRTRKPGLSDKSNDGVLPTSPDSVESKRSIRSFRRDPIPSKSTESRHRTQGHY